MLIHDLYQYALENNLGMEPPTKEGGKITHRLILNRKGYVRLEERKTFHNLMSKSRTRGVNPNELYDNRVYITGYGAETAERGPECFESFWKTAVDFLEACGDKEALKAVQALTQDSSWKAEVLKTLKLEKHKSSWIALQLEGDDTLMIDRPLVKRYISERYEKEVTGESGPDICLISGQSCQAVRLHAVVRNLPHVGKGVAPLVSFNTTSSTYKGLVQGENFTISNEVNMRYTAALDHLLKTSANISVENEHSVAVLVWGPKGLDVTHLLNKKSKAEDIAAAWEALEDFKDSTEVARVVTLRGSERRIALASYDLITTKDLVKNLMKFREAFEGRVERPSIGAMLGAIENHRKSLLSINSKAKLATTLLLGKPLPGTFIKYLLNNLSPKQAVDDNGRVTYRAAHCLLWLELFNMLRIDLTLKDPQMSKTSDMPHYITVNAPQPYILGRLVSLSFALRQLSQKEPQFKRPGIKVSTALHMAITRPSVFYVTLAKDLGICQQRLKSRGWSGAYYLKQIQEIYEALGTQILTRTTPMKSTEASLLVHGYNQQFIYDITPRAKEEEEEEEVAEAS